MQNDLDDLRQLIKGTAENYHLIACDGCGKQTIVADVCPLCESTYCSQCIIAHVEDELARLEQQWRIAAENPAQLAGDSENGDDFT